MLYINPNDIKLNIYNNLDLASFKDFIVENSDSTFAKNILASGIESYFNSLDKDNNGILNEFDSADIDSAILADPASFDSDIEEINLSNFLGSSSSSDSREEEQIKIAQNTEAVEAVSYQSEAENSGGLELNQPFVQVSSVSREMSFTSEMLAAILSSYTTAPNTTEYGVDDLKKQKILLQLSSNAKVQILENELSSLILNNTQVNKKLKNSYSEKQQELNSCEDSIKETEQQIAENEAKKAAVEAQIASINSQLGSAKNTDEKAGLDAVLNGLYEQQATLTESISSLNASLIKLNTQKDSLETELDTILVDISKNSIELSSAITEKRQEIALEKANQTNAIASMDAQITSKEAEAALAMQKQAEADALVNTPTTEAGETLTAQDENKIGESFVKDALQYMGQRQDSRKEFSGAWCAKFVTMVVKEVYKALGKKVPEGFGSAAVAGLRDWAKKNDCFLDTSNMGKSEKLSYIKNNVLPGDIIVWKQGGVSHVGFVKEVDKNGNITTVEGNWSDKVASRDLDDYNNYGVKNITGFIRLS